MTSSGHGSVTEGPARGRPPWDTGQLAPGGALPIPSPVLILTNQLCLGGAEVYVVTVSRWLAERGVQVIVAATPGELAERLHPAVVYHPVPLQDLRWSVPIAAARVRQLIRRHRPQVVLANSLVTAWVGTLAQAGFDLPVVTVAHGWPKERYPSVAPPLRVADAVVAVSPMVGRQLVAAGLTERRCHVIHNGVDLSPFAAQPVERRIVARTALGASPGDLVVTNIGRYTDQKAQQHVVAVAAALRQRHPRLRYAIVGWGEREAELRAMIARAGVEDRVRLLVNRTDVSELLLASDLFLNCSDWEGMPLSTIEAMGAGLPIVATATEGAPELLGAENARVVPVGDAFAMAEAISAIAADPALRQRMSEASRSRARERFSQDRMCGALAALLERAVAGDV